MPGSIENAEVFWRARGGMCLQKPMAAWLAGRQNDKFHKAQICNPSHSVIYVCLYCNLCPFTTLENSEMVIFICKLLSHSPCCWPGYHQFLRCWCPRPHSLALHCCLIFSLCYLDFLLGVPWSSGVVSFLDLPFWCLVGAQFYDVECQHSINFPRRVEPAQYLEYPFEKMIYYGIGAFHISRHVPECVLRYSLQFMLGVGIVDGKVLECLWPTLNEVSPSAQTASLAARTELLDNHMLDSNWKKIINQGMLLGILQGPMWLIYMDPATSVVQKYQTAIPETEESEHYYQGLCENLDSRVQKQWEDKMANAQAQHTSDISAMDIFNLAMENSIFGQFPHIFANNSVQPHPAWRNNLILFARSQNLIINPGITVSKQISAKKNYLMTMLYRLQLAVEARQVKKDKRDEAQIALPQKCQALEVWIEEYHEKAEWYLPPKAVDDIRHPGDNVDDGWIDNEWKDIVDNRMEIPDAPFSFSFPLLSILIEMVHDTKKKVIFLPSTIGCKRCAKLGLQSLIKKEIALRKGQVNNSLQAIRLAIGEKSFQFCKQLWLAASKKKKTCSWDRIHIIGKQLQHHCLIYWQAHHALSRLGVLQETLETEFRELTDDDLQTSSAIMEPNAQEQRKKELSWIWQRTSMRISNQTTLMNECTLYTSMHNGYQLTGIPVYHVNWLRARSHWDWWKEELLIAGHKMV